MKSVFTSGSQHRCDTKKEQLSELFSFFGTSKIIAEWVRCRAAVPVMCHAVVCYIFALLVLPRGSFFFCGRLFVLCSVGCYGLSCTSGSIGGDGIGSSRRRGSFRSNGLIGLYHPNTTTISAMARIRYHSPTSRAMMVPMRVIRGLRTSGPVRARGTIHALEPI